jgi:hypothetical protein
VENQCHSIHAILLIVFMTIMINIFIIIIFKNEIFISKNPFNDYHHVIWEVYIRPGFLCMDFVKRYVCIKHYLLAFRLNISVAKKYCVNFNDNGELPRLCYDQGHRGYRVESLSESNVERPTYTVTPFRELGSRVPVVLETSICTHTHTHTHTHLYRSAGN